MRESITTCGELVGAVLVTAGVWTYSSSLGLMVAGVSLAFFSWLASR